MGRQRAAPPLEVLGPAGDSPVGRGGLTRAQLLQARQGTAGVSAKPEVAAYIGL